MILDAASFGDWFPVLLWPVTFLYVLLWVMILRWAAAGSTMRGVAAVAMVLPAPFIVRYLLNNSSQSLVHLFDYYFLFVTVGVICCFIFVRFLFRPMPVASKMSVMILCALFGPFSLFFGLNVLVQDYALSRLVIDGKISRLGVTDFSKRAPEYEATIETKRFWTTPDVFATLHEGDRVRAEIGKGSRYIYSIERMP